MGEMGKGLGKKRRGRCEPGEIGMKGEIKDQKKKENDGERASVTGGFRRLTVLDTVRAGKNQKLIRMSKTISREDGKRTEKTYP